MIPVIDMHCDTISAILSRRRSAPPAGKTTVSAPPAGKATSSTPPVSQGTVGQGAASAQRACLRENDLHVDLLRMKAAGYMCQSFALFTYLPELQATGEDPFEHAMALSDLLDSELAINADLIRPALTAEDIRKNFREGNMSSLKTIEEGAVYRGDLENIRCFYDLGVRKSTLTWNFENELAYPNLVVTDPETGMKRMIPETIRGLKNTGREAVKLMEEMGMLIDVSHLGDAGILEILDLVDPHTPVIASHSNARAVTNHARNLTDDMLRLIADHGGVTGINFSSSFLTDDGSNETRIADMVRHAKHIRNVAGIDALGLGTDFDGIGSNLVELSGGEKMQLLADGLSCAGFTANEIDKIFYENVLRVFKTVLG